MNTSLAGIKKFYEEKYKLLLIIPFLLLLFALIQIGYQYNTTGDFVNKGITLKGGSVITIPPSQGVSSAELEDVLTGKFGEVDVRTIGSNNNPTGLIVESEIQDSAQLEPLLDQITQKTTIPRSDMSVEIIGSSLGAAFFTQSLIALLFAFLLMGIVVLLYFRTLVPSFAVILAGFSDIVVTLAIFNLTGEKLSTAGIAAFLMLIGYSVDTDVLLTSRVLKRKEGTVMERVYSAINTGLSMTSTTLAAILVALLFVNSEVIFQIMLILFIGLMVDMVFTWIQNVGILRFYLEKKKK